VVAKDASATTANDNHSDGPQNIPAKNAHYAKQLGKARAAILNAVPGVKEPVAGGPGGSDDSANAPNGGAKSHTETRRRKKPPGDDGIGPDDIIVYPGDLPWTAREVRDRLVDHPAMFEKSGVPVRTYVNADDRLMWMPLTEFDIVNLVHENFHVRKWSAPKDGTATKLIPVTLPQRLARLYLANVGSFNLRPLRGITEAPLLSDNGSILICGGAGTDPAGMLYHARTRMISRCRVPIKVKRDITDEDARSALRRLRELFQNVAWGDSQRVTDADGFDVTDLEAAPGIDETAGILAALTLLCRPSLNLAPAVAVTAPALSGSGVGKTFLVELICQVVLGRLPRVFSLGRDETEQEKRLIGAYLEGPPVALFDNMNGITFHNDTFSSAMTTESFRARRLGGSDSFEIDSRMMPFFTGNDFKFGEDLIRRSLVIRLDSRRENSENRRLPRSVQADALAHHGDHLSDLLTIWCWGRKNRQSLFRGRPLAGFDTWAEWCRDPLIALGCPDPLTRLDETRSGDPYRARTTAIFVAWWSAHGSDLITAFDLAEPVLAAMHPDKRSRQYVAPQVAKLIGSRVGGFVLEAFPPTAKSDPFMYRLQRTHEPTTTPEEGVL
jgi:hypothetical protein